MTTIFAVVGIIVVLFIVNQANEMGASFPLILVAIVTVLLIIVGLVRNWLRG